MGYENQLSGKKKKEMKFAIGMSRPSFESGPIKGLYQVTEDDQVDEEAKVDPFPEDMLASGPQCSQTSEQENLKI